MSDSAERAAEPLIDPIKGAYFEGFHDGSNREPTDDGSWHWEQSESKHLARRVPVSVAPSPVAELKFYDHGGRAVLNWLIEPPAEGTKLYAAPVAPPDALGNSINAAAQEPPLVPAGWIAVSEREPDPNPNNDANSVRVLFYVPSNRAEYSVQIGSLWYRAHGDGYWNGDRGYDRKEVTHWQPLAAAPALVPNEP